MPNLKQLKDNAGQLYALFSSITARSIAEPLQSCCETDDAPSVKRRMEELDFDVFGLQDADGVVKAYVERVDLVQGRCGQYRTPFKVADLVAESASLIRILQILRDQPRVFVLTDNQVTGIVTRGDLQKTPVRIYLSGLFSLLEMQLLRLVCEYYPGDSWKEKLEPGRLGIAERLWDSIQDSQ